MNKQPEIRKISTEAHFPIAHGLPASVAQALLKQKLCGEEASADSIADTLLRRDAWLLAPVYYYIAYLKLVSETSLATAELFDRRSPPNSHGKKEHLRHTGPEDIFHIANYLYVLHDAGIEGTVLECGTSHGYSACCLSHACGRLNRHLYGADSFQGLPSQAAGESFFRPGDYASPKEAVLENLRAVGRWDAVSLVEGWFSESLRGWNVPVALLWLDVDLYDSARDVMMTVLPHVQPRGAIVMHEFTDFYNRLPERNEKRPPNAVWDALEARGMTGIGIHIHRYLGAVLFPDSPGRESFAVAAALWPRLLEIDSRWRLYDELRNARTVRWLFAIKRAIMGR